MNILSLLAATLTLLLSQPSAAEGTKGPLVSDGEFFNALNLEYPGLEAVKDDVAEGDWKAASADFVKYLKSRTYPKWFFDWRDCGKVRNPSFNTALADKYARNLLVSVGVWHQFEDPITDWSVNPTPLKYKEWTWQLSRHPYWVVLGKAYWATGDEKYARAFVSQMRSWVETNPVPDFANQEQGSRWRTIEAGIRTLGSWPESFNYFLASPSFDDESVMMMVKSFYEHAVYLRKFNSRNNWLTMEMNGLFHVALLFPEFKDATDWAAFASEKLYQEEKVQFYADGAQVELAPGYHWVSVNNMLGIYRIARLNGYALPGDYVKRLEASFEYFEKIALPSGAVPAVNDSGWQKIADHLAEGWDCFPERDDFLYMSTGGKKGTEPPFRSVWMPWAGWYAMRSGWDSDALYAFFEVGPFAPAHNHEDKLSLILQAYGNRLVTECGTYAYDTSQWRKYALSARGHNVTRVDGGDQNRRGLGRLRSVQYNSAPMPNRWVSNDVFEFGEGWYTEGFGEKHDKTVSQYRALVYVRDRYWVVIDVMNPADGKVHSYDSWFHLNTAEYSLLKKNGGIVSADPTGANVALIPVCAKGLTCEVVCGSEAPEVQGWVKEGSSSIYKCRPVATPVFHRKASGTVVEPYLFCPIRPGETLPVRKVSAKSPTDFVIVFTDGTRDRISFTVSDGAIRTLSVNGREM